MVFLSDSNSELSSRIIRRPNLQKRTEDQSGWAREKILIYIAIEQSFSLNDLFWAVLVAPMDSFNKIVANNFIQY